MKKIIIFIDSHNDLDNILPFIDYVLSSHKVKIILYKVKGSDLIGCKGHLEYLKNTYNIVPANYDKNFSKQYAFLMKIYWVLLKYARRAKQKSYLLPFLILIIRFNSVVSYLTQREVRKNQRELDADVIMMDFGKELGLYGAEIVNYSQNKKVTVVGYLHGFSIYTNLDVLQKDKAIISDFKRFILKLAKSQNNRKYCDRYVVGIEQRETYFSSSMMSNYDVNYLNRVYEVGVPRYATEWIAKYRNNIMKSNSFTYGENNRINVVLFMSHPQYNVQIDALMDTIKELFRCKKINFVYKPHTRNGLDRIKSKEIKGYDATNISSLELSAWADVGIVYGSSIALQLLQDDVPLIMPRYVHLNSTIFEKNEVCITVDSLSDLVDIFSYSKGEIYKMVSQDKVKSFIQHYVYGNEDYNNLMKNFYNSTVGT